MHIRNAAFGRPEAAAEKPRRGAFYRERFDSAAVITHVPGGRPACVRGVSGQKGLNIIGLS
jgi:hypothetical protein